MSKSEAAKSKDIRYSQPTKSDRELQQQYAGWFTKGFRWDLFATLTFPRDLTSDHANSVLTEYLRLIEKKARAPLACLIAEEVKYPGSEAAPDGIHFHLLIHCAQPLDPLLLTKIWRMSCFGGDRTAGPSAKVLVLDRGSSPAFYMMKGLFDANCNWRPWRLHNASKRKPASFATSSKTRRSWKRQQKRAVLLRHS